MRIVGAVLAEKHVHPDVSFTVSPGSKQVLKMIADDGSLGKMIAAGARILESACGPCIGMGQAPPSGGVSLRTFNRNFEGRSGTKDAKVYLCSPEVAVASAVAGVLVDPRELGAFPELKLPEKYLLDDSSIIAPAADPTKVEVRRGPNIAPLAVVPPMADDIRAQVLLKVGDNITTDHIMPAGARVLPYRSNIPKMSQFVFEGVDPTFPARAKEAKVGFIVGGMNYGQGSSREHAGLAPAYLGVKAVFATAFARIHRANLVNFGILPLVIQPVDYAKIRQGDVLFIKGAPAQVKAGTEILVTNETQGYDLVAAHNLSAREVEIVVAGGLLNHTKQGKGKQ
jgi:aconitate hydratase